MATGTLEPGSFDLEEAKRRAAAGPRVLIARRLALLLLTFVSTVTVARLVPPRDFGLAAMSAITLSFVQVFRDVGLTNAVLRKPTIDQAEVTMVFWFNVIMTSVLTIALALAAPLIAEFFGAPIVLWVVLASLIGFQVGGVALQHRALINRELRFSAIAAIDIISQLVGFLITLTLAFVRHDVWALVIGNICQSIIAAGLAVSLSHWRPSKPVWKPEFVDLIKFGANSTVYSLSVIASKNTPQLLVGHLLGAAPLGEYNRAQTLFQFPSINLVQPITQSALPLLTHLRVDPAQYRTAYLGLIRRLCVFLFPLAAMVPVSAVPLVRALLGPQWTLAGYVLAALSPALLAIGVGYAADDIFISQNRARELRNLGLAEVTIRIGSVLFGIHFGIIQAALAASLSTVAAVMLRVWLAGRSGPVSFPDQMIAAVPGIAPALGALAAAGVASRLLSSPSDAIAAVVIVAAGMFGGLVVGLPFARSRAAMLDLLSGFWFRRRVQRA